MTTKREEVSSIQDAVETAVKLVAEAFKTMDFVNVKFILGSNDREIVQWTLTKPKSKEFYEDLHDVLNGSLVALEGEEDVADFTQGGGTLIVAVVGANIMEDFPTSRLQ